MVGLDGDSLTLIPRLAIVMVIQIQIRRCSRFHFAYSYAMTVPRPVADIESYYK